jgi:plastocyanin
MRKIRRCLGFGFLRRLGFLLPLAAPLAAQAGGSVTGRVTIVDKDGRQGGDVAQSVIWLTGPEAPTAAPTEVEMATEGKQFVPRLLVVARGSTVRFPNHDPFNHNVFSLSPEGTFDLGLYGRGEAKGTTFGRAGVIRVYCNVHAQMRGLVLVLESALNTLAGGDGGFHLEGVPPGDYVLHAWHERGSEVSQPLTVTGRSQPPVAITVQRAVTGPIRPVARSSTYAPQHASRPVAVRRR